MGGHGVVVVCFEGLWMLSWGFVVDGLSAVDAHCTSASAVLLEAVLQLPPSVTRWSHEQPVHLVTVPSVETPSGWMLMIPMV